LNCPHAIKSESRFALNFHWFAGLHLVKREFLMSRITIIIACILLTSCASGYQQFYKPYVDARTLPDVKMLGEGEEPNIFTTNDLDRDAKIAISRGYRPIGTSSFNGKLGSKQEVIDQAKEIGAVLVLVNAKFAGTRTTTSPLFLPNNQTTYNSGSVYGTYGSANYTGTSTTYDTTVIPITTHQQRYDQTALYFVKSSKRPKFGLFLIDLSPELRLKYERNTGAIVNIVAEDSPAFKANVLPGDVLIELNGNPITNAKHAKELMESTSPNDGKCSLKVIHNGTEKLIELQLVQSAVK
jgi:hypothetical protein